MVTKAVFCALVVTAVLLLIPGPAEARRRQGLNSHEFSAGRPVVDQVDGSVRWRASFQPLLSIERGWKIRPERDKYVPGPSWADPSLDEAGWLDGGLGFWDEMFDPVSWYRVHFVPPALPDDERVYLVFGGIPFSAPATTAPLCPTNHCASDSSLTAPSFTVTTPSNPAHYCSDVRRTICPAC